MTDYSEAELLAIEKCFPGTQVYLCDFHREQVSVVLAYFYLLI